MPSPNNYRNISTQSAHPKQILASDQHSCGFHIEFLLCKWSLRLDDFFTAQVTWAGLCLKQDTCNSCAVNSTLFYFVTTAIVLFFPCTCLMQNQDGEQDCIPTISYFTTCHFGDKTLIWPLNCRKLHAYILLLKMKIIERYESANGLNYREDQLTTPNLTLLKH